MEQCFRKEELMGSGHLACQGCAATIAMRLVLKVLGKKTIITMPACCWSVIAGPFPFSNLDVPLYHCAFETAASTAAGVRAALDALGKKDIHVLAWAGDGGTFDIGIQALSGSAERGDNIIYVCYDNEAYMNTGIQRSSATPYGAWTTTTPEQYPKEVPKKDMTRIMAAHKIPYIAVASVAYPKDLMQKIEKAKNIQGTRFIHILSPCPPGWRIASNETIEIARMATASRVFPLYEIFDGEKYVLSMDLPPIPVREYLKKQGRFAHLSNAEIEYIEMDVKRKWERLIKDCKS